MLQNRYKDKKGFTLLEMVITMGLLVIFVSSVSLFFSFMTDSFVTSQFIGKSYEKVQQFKGMYTYNKSKYPQVIFESGGVTDNNTNGFKLLAFADVANQNGFMIGVYDLQNNKVVSGTDLNYSDYVVFTKVLDSTGITSVQSNMTSYLNLIGSGGLVLQKDIKIVKLSYEPLNSTSIGRLDLTIVPEYYKEYKNQTVERFMTNNKLLTTFNISIVK